MLPGHVGLPDKQGRRIRLRAVRRERLDVKRLAIVVVELVREMAKEKMRAEAVAVDDVTPTGWSRSDASARPDA